MPVSGGTPTRIGANADPEQAVWSPDGKRILLLGRCEPLGAITTCVSTADGRDLKPNHDLDREIVDLNTDLAGWVATPSSVIIQKRVSDQYVLTAVPVTEDGTRVTGSPVKLASLTDPIVHVSTAVEGRVVMAVSTAKVHTWELPIDANGHQAGAPAQITAGPEGETGGTLSRDGGQFVFTSPRANGERLLYKDLTTGHQKEISTGEGAYWSAAFNRDGSGLMAAQGEAVYYLPLSGGVPKKIWEVPKLAALGVDGARRGDFLSLWDWSPDGKTLLLTMAIPRGSGKATRPRLAFDGAFPGRSGIRYLAGSFLARWTLGCLQRNVTEGKIFASLYCLVSAKLPYRAANGFRLRTANGTTNRDFPRMTK